MASPASQPRWYRGSHDADSVAHEGHPRLGGQVDERLSADVDLDPGFHGVPTRLGTPGS
jgi:hypothetical protein